MITVLHESNPASAGIVGKPVYSVLCALKTAIENE